MRKFGRDRLKAKVSTTGKMCENLVWRLFLSLVSRSQQASMIVTSSVEFDTIFQGGADLFEDQPISPATGKTYNLSSVC
jgi:hypothetical protein